MVLSTYKMGKKRLLFFESSSQLHLTCLAYGQTVYFCVSPNVTSSGSLFRTPLLSTGFLMSVSYIIKTLMVFHDRHCKKASPGFSRYGSKNRGKARKAPAT